MNLTIPEVFLVVGLLNAVVASYIFSVVPEYGLRFMAFLLSRIMYRVEYRGQHHIPVQGAAILVCNHVSFIDALLIMAGSPRPIRFVMDHRIFQSRTLGWVFRLVKAIPIAPRQEEPVLYETAFTACQQVLQEGELLCIFPEGRITPNGELGEFKAGILKILQNQPVPVVPLALHNLWGSFFSRMGGRAMSRPFRRGIWSRVSLRASAPIPAHEATLPLMRQRVLELLA
jgi:1-acyl-sn-glycerol-3-phosphate acyltransferase